MIKQLKITHVRNLHHVHLTLGDCNVFVGDNGSGKTSLLEAVFLLSRGKTFRHHEPKHYVRHHQKFCTVWAKTEDDILAVKKTLDDKNLSSTILRLNEQTVVTQSLLSYAVPALLIDPSGMTVLEEGSHARRQMLDWLAFHVKPNFYDEWLSHQRLLKQRNLLLKSPNIHSRIEELRAWDVQLAHHAQRLHDYRQEVFVLWQVRFLEMLHALLPNYCAYIYLSYQAGFDDKEGLLSVLTFRLDSDMELGYTRVGAHRADVMVMLRQPHEARQIKSQAADVLSRGEKKLLIIALKLAQLQVMCEHHRTKPVVLLDDIDAELDEQAMKMLLEVLLSLPCQLMITSLQDSTADKIAQRIKSTSPTKDIKKFHVKHGEVRHEADWCST